MQNYGLDIRQEALDVDLDKDWTFGAGSKKCIALVPKDKRKEYLPKGEIQKGKDDFMDCVTRAWLNKLETKLTYYYRHGMSEKNKRWLEDNGYVVEGNIVLSDRFNAMLSNTTRQGNSLKAPGHSLHEAGVIPKALLPSNKNMTWEDYHNRSDITPQMVYLGQEFLKRFPLNYDRVYESSFKTVDDMVIVAGHAWSRPKRGVYPRTEKTFNHSFLDIYPEWEIFDNYLDRGKEGDFIKTLAPDYKFLNYGYRLFISADIPEPTYENWVLDLMKRLLDLVGVNISKIKNADGTKEEKNKLIKETTKKLELIKDNMVKEEMTPQEKLLNLAKDNLGVDISPHDRVPDYVGCVESFSMLIKKLDPSFPLYTGTWTINDVMKKDKRFKPTLDYEPGVIICCPTGTGYGIIPGHIGVALDNGKIASNNSLNGLWDDFYTKETWDARYIKKGGFKNNLYKYVG